MPRPRTLSLAVVLVGLVGVAACHSAEVINPTPSVTFTRPAGAVMYVRGGGGVTRAQFNGRKRVPPVLCEETNVLVDVNIKGASREHTLRSLASRPGFARVQLHGPDGKLLAKGRFCVFPTLKSVDRTVLSGYSVEIPAVVIRRLARGRTAAIYQSYLPKGAKDVRWQHVAWVLYLDPR